MRFLLYNLRIRRVEFLVAEIPIVALPLLLTLHESAPLRQGWLWEGVLLFFLLFHFGDMINCLCDRDLDAVYKPRLSQAVYGLGVRVVIAQIAATAAAALAIAVHLSWRLHNPRLAGLVVIGLFLGAAYSVPPVQLKGRGLWGLYCLWCIIFVGPMMLMASLVGESPSLLVLCVAAAYGALQMGVILVNTAEDYPEDRAANIRTSILSLGLHRGICLAKWLVILGGAGVLVALGGLLPVRHFAALLPLLAALIYVGRDLSVLSRTIDAQDLPASIQTVKRAAKKVPIWITLNAWSAFIAALSVFLS